MARARIITSGLRRRGMNGPETSADRAALHSATAARWASVSFSAGIGGIRSCASSGCATVKTAAASIEIVVAIVARIGTPFVTHIVAYTVPASVDHIHRPDGRPLRLALVGFGYWGPNYARVLNDLPGVELTVGCDPNLAGPGAR